MTRFHGCARIIPEVYSVESPRVPDCGSNTETLPEEIIQLSESLVQNYEVNATLRNLMSNVTDICSGWAPCNILRRADPGSECCLKCFCDVNCNKVRPCCPGFQPNRTIQEIPIGFVDIPKVCVESAYFINDRSISFNTIDFEMVVDCPHGTPTEIKDKCTALFTNAEEDFNHSFLDIIPVSDSLTQTNFANKHCAECNGLPTGRYLKWSLVAACDGELVFDSESLETEIQQRDDCFLRVIPPSFEIGNATQCFSDMTSQCNVTGMWDSFDPKIEHLCMEVDWVYGTPKSPSIASKRYKNIFCAICNGEVYKEIGERICPDDDFGEVTLGYSVLLNFDANFQESIADTKDNVNRCPLGLLVDPLIRYCKEVVCSFPRVLNKLTMRCADRFESMTYGSVEIPYKFGLEATHTFKLKGLVQFHEYLYQAMNPLRDGIECNFHSIFYKTDTDFDSIRDQNFIDGNAEVVSGIVIVYADIGKPYIRSYQSVVEKYLRLNITVANRLIELEYGDVETAYLPTARNTSHPDTNTKLLGEIPLISSQKVSIYMYNDPFDGRTLLRLGEFFDVDLCVTKNLLYRKTYYECSAFEYDMKVNEINYTSTGIRITKENIHLNFGEFKMLNMSHVAICLDKLEEKGLKVGSKLLLSGSAGKKGLTRTSVMIILMLLIFRML